MLYSHHKLKHAYVNVSNTLTATIYMDQTFNSASTSDVLPLVHLHFVRDNDVKYGQINLILLTRGGLRLKMR